ncbi:MAG: CapA family protein, partial [Anaerolineales bacterium]|nr:CapA family protein [Anaerolineales bacterium]
RLDAPTSAVSWLQAAGFDLLGLANNHSLDIGPAGLEATFQRLRSAGIKPVGVGRSHAEAYQPVIIRQDGLRIGFLAFNLVPAFALDQPIDRGTWVVAGGQPERMISAVRSARSQADVVVVSVHWGDEYALFENPAQRDLARQLVEAGADLVVGHHPHTIQGTQVFEGAAGASAGFVAYSLGNFVFDQQDERAQRGLALRCLLDHQGLSGVQALPVRSGPHPRWMTPAETAELDEHIRPDPRWVGYTCRQYPCLPAKPGHEQPQAIFWSGEIDLTGDGVAEIVRRINEQVIVYHRDEIAWQSPKDWQVIDLALGDPNDDGRYELMLAIRKPGEDGSITSHPFVIGYRSGIYRQLWGGSAVADSLREVELGDLDGDGIQELIALEDAADGQKRVITVWRWHGWGFQLLWRSEEAWFHDLSLVQGSAGNLTVIQAAEDW